MTFNTGSGQLNIGSGQRVTLAVTLNNQRGGEERKEISVSTDVVKAAFRGGPCEMRVLTLWQRIQDFFQGHVRQRALDALTGLFSENQGSAVDGWNSKYASFCALQRCILPGGEHLLSSSGQNRRLRHGT